MMDTQDIINQVNLWGKAEPTTKYLEWARRYYTDLYAWQRWWCMAQLKPNQRDQVWEGERKLERSYTPAELCMQYGLKCDKIDQSKIPDWRYLIGHNIGLMDNLNQELLDYENIGLIDRLVLSKSI